jgi:hypothetical protein
LSGNDAVGDETPVADYNAFETELPTEKVGDDTLVHTSSHLLVLGTHGPRVVRHDLPPASCDSRLEGNEMVFKIVSGICSVLAVSEVAVLTIFDGSTSGEMLRYGGDRVLAKLTRAVETLDVSNDELSGQGSVLSHRSGNSGPPGFGCHIDLRV